MYIQWANFLNCVLGWCQIGIMCRDFSVSASTFRNTWMLNRKKFSECASVTVGTHFSHLCSSSVCACLPQTSEWLNCPDNIFFWEVTWVAHVTCAHLVMWEWDSSDVSWDIFSDLSVCCWTVKQKPNYLTLVHNGLKKSGGKVVAIRAEHATLKSNICLLMPHRIKMRTLTCWMVSICHTGDTILSVRSISVVWQRGLPRKKRTIRSKILYKQIKKWEKNEAHVSL